MKPYMLVMITEDGSKTVQFYDEYDNAVEGYNICASLIGWNCELYVYEHIPNCDKIPNSYELMGYRKIM